MEIIGFWSEGKALAWLRTGAPDDPRTAAARAYLMELRAALQASADSISAALAAA